MRTIQKQSLSTTKQNLVSTNNWAKFSGHKISSKVAQPRNRLTGGSTAPSWGYYGRQDAHLPPIPPRNTLATLDPISWRYKYWYDYRGVGKETYPHTYLTPRVNQYTLDGNQYQNAWHNPGYWLCGDQSCPLCYPASNRDPKSYLTEYWRSYLNANPGDPTYDRWWSQHWPHFYGSNTSNYWYYPNTA